MRSLSVRNLSDETYEALKQMAAINHRSLQEQVRYLLDLDAKLLSHSKLAAAKKWREWLAQRALGDTLKDIQEDRTR